VRQRDIIASGRSGQAARQKVCAAILVVCSAAPMVRTRVLIHRFCISLAVKALLRKRIELSLT
jgi:hypothetical protein